MLLEGQSEGDPSNLMKVVGEIRADLNPHPAGQKTLNAPKNDALTGVQHKYSETVLVFPAAAQTCHAYCVSFFLESIHVEDYGKTNLDSSSYHTSIL